MEHSDPNRTRANDAMVEVPACIGKNGPEVLTQDPIPLFQQGLIMQQLNPEKLIVQAAIEGSYQKALEAFTLNKTIRMWPRPS